MRPVTMLRCVRIVSDRGPEEVMVEDSLNGFKKAIWLAEDDCIHGTPTRIGGVVYVLYHDDSGRLKELPTTVIDPFGRSFIVGPVLVAKHDGCDGETSMTDADVDAVLGRVVTFSNGRRFLLMEAGA